MAAARQATSSYMALAALLVVLGTVAGWLQHPNFMVFMPAAPLMGEAQRGGDALLTPPRSSVARPAMVSQQSSCFLVAFGAAAVAAAAAVGASRKQGKAGAGRLHAVQMFAEAKESEIVAKDDEGEEYDSDDDLEEYDSDDDSEDGLLYDDDNDDKLYLQKDEKDDDRPFARCKARFLRGSPQKFRRVLWQIRGRSYREALMILEFMPYRHCKPTLVALQSAAANAQNHMNMDKSRLYVKKCKALDGPTSKRMKPISKGQSHPFKRRTTHLEIQVAEMTDAEIARNKRF
eukprot:TRINITY_DN223_c0_g1_i1.p1 TRINITY_DN223_c0_g1~~TRINITY_DN223_c0_g1_i1.p1  ORF type:complete len:289 (-),score=65.44 TRINITY_DN223_c0_g1_i1:67-933(-)